VSAAATIGRITLLVLSGTATLSLIGAIAETANTGPAPPPAARSGPPSPLDRAVTSEGEWVAVPDRGAAPVEPRPHAADTEQWLRAISYALTALAGFTAACLVVLLRIAGALARIAERRND
jgi:hypothetical protein